MALECSIASVDLPSMEISFPWNSAIHTGSWDWPCTWHAVFIFHLCCNHCQCFWPFYGFVVFHCLCVWTTLLTCSLATSLSRLQWLVLLGCALRNGPHGKSLTFWETTCRQLSWFLRWCWGFELRFSCLKGSHSYPWILSLLARSIAWADLELRPLTTQRCDSMSMVLPASVMAQCSVEDTSRRVSFSLPSISKLFSNY